MSKNEYHYKVNGFVVWVWTSFTVLSLFLGVSWYQEDRAEKEKIANMSSTEYVVYQETLAAEAALPGKRRKAPRFSHGDIRRNLVPLYRDSEIKFIGQLLLT